MLRRVVVELQSGLRRIEGFIDVEAKDIPESPEGHTLVRIGKTYVLYKESPDGQV